MSTLQVDLNNPDKFREEMTDCDVTVMTTWGDPTNTPIMFDNQMAGVG